MKRKGTDLVTVSYFKKYKLNDKNTDNFVLAQMNEVNHACMNMEIDDGSIKYTCIIHDDDPSICNIYDCMGNKCSKLSYQNSTNTTYIT